MTFISFWHNGKEIARDMRWHEFVPRVGDTVVFEVPYAVRNVEIIYYKDGHGRLSSSEAKVFLQ